MILLSQNKKYLIECLDEIKTIIENEEEKDDNSIKYKNIEELFYREMNFYEFIELIFFICRKYYLKQNPNAVFAEIQVPRKEKTKEKQKEKQIKIVKFIKKRKKILD